MAVKVDRITPAAAKKWIAHAIAAGAVVVTRHALAEMEQDGLQTPDCVNVMRAGVVDEAEAEQGAWRYRVHTQHITVVVELDSAADEVVLITAWRNRTKGGRR